MYLEHQTTLVPKAHFSVQNHDLVSVSLRTLARDGFAQLKAKAEWYEALRMKNKRKGQAKSGR